MQSGGEMDLQALAQLNDIDVAEGEQAGIRSRAIDSDGDGRPDLYLVDLDDDGSIDGVVRGLDANGDGVNDTFIQYNEDGSIQSIGRIDPATGQLDVVYEEPDALDKILDSLGIADLESPEQALFTSFEDPYIFETYGSFGDEVPDVYSEPEMVDDFSIVEVDEEDVDAPEADVLDAEPAAVETEDSVEEPPGVTPRIVEIEDRSGGEGSSLWAKVDEDADGLADYDTQIDKTSTGTYYGDIDKDGYSEDLATDLDMDGRIDTVDTAGKGSSADTVSAEQIVEPESDHLVDRGTVEDDSLTSDALDDGIAAGSDYDVGTSDLGSTESESIDAGYDNGSADTSYDSGSSLDTGGGDDTV
jgi:hypothetical protein